MTEHEHEHDPSEDQRIAAVVREHFAAHEQSVMADQHDPEATIRAPIDEHRDGRDLDTLVTDLRRIADYIESTRCNCTSQLGLVVARAARLDGRSIAEALEIVGRAALVADGVHRLERHELRGLRCSASVESQPEAEPEPEPEPTRAAARPRVRKLARRVGIVFAWLVLIAVAIAVCTAAQVSVVVGQQALVSDGIHPLAAAAVDAPSWSDPAVAGSRALGLRLLARSNESNHARTAVA